MCSRGVLQFSWREVIMYFIFEEVSGESLALAART